MVENRQGVKRCVGGKIATPMDGTLPFAAPTPVRLSCKWKSPAPAILELRCANSFPSPH